MVCLHMRTGLGFSGCPVPSSERKGSLNYAGRTVDVTSARSVSGDSRIASIWWVGCVRILVGPALPFLAFQFRLALFLGQRENDCFG